MIRKTSVALSLILACGLLAVQAGRSAEAAKVPSGGPFEVEVVKDVAYSDAKDADEVRHKLDLYLPKGHKDFPVLLFIHGGGWRNGSKNGFAKQGQLLARNGVGVVAVNYRLSPKVKHPEHIKDVARAFAWTHQNIAKYGGRPDQLFVSGHSAGGHLAALLAVDDSYLKAEKLALKDVKGVIPISGVFRVGGGRLGEVFGDADSSRQASPLTHVRAGLPPFLILYGDKELGNLGKQAEEFGQALQKDKCTVKVVMVDDRTHGSIMGKMVTQEDPVTQRVLGFIAQYSGLKLTAKDAGAKSGN
jgi:acetyl esterase/lipase